MVRNKQQQPSSTGARLGALRPRNIGLVAVLCLVTLGAALPQTGAELVGDARALLEQWVETRRVISLEERDWSLGRQTLDDRIELIEREIEQKREQIAGTEESISEADRKREELLQKNALLEEASRVLADRVGGLEARTKTLLVRLPEPIRERVMPLSQRLPEDPADTKLSLSERFQNVVGLLNEVNKFHREITVTSEVRQLVDGTSAEVTAVYAGISQGWYVDATRRFAGSGQASSGEWTWTPADDAAEEIARVIAIYENEQPADFVSLPLRSIRATE